MINSLVFSKIPYCPRVFHYRNMAYNISLSNHLEGYSNYNITTMIYNLSIYHVYPFIRRQAFINFEVSYK